MKKNKSITGEIYCATSPSNKKYIGQCLSFDSKGRKYGTKGRWRKHISEAKNCGKDKGCRALNNAILKYGDKNFILETLIICNAEFLDEYEKKFQLLYNTIAPNGYNLIIGGSGGKRCKETRERMSKAWLGHKLSDETKLKISNSLKGDKNPNWGKKHSKETLKKMSEKQTKENHPFWNKKHKEDSKDKISNSARKYFTDMKLPKYLRKYNGYNGQIGFCVTYGDGNKKNKSFSNSSLTLEEKLTLALKFHKEVHSNKSYKSRYQLEKKQKIKPKLLVQIEENDN